MTKTIEARVGILESENKNQEVEIKNMGEDIKEIKDTLLKRPSWGVTIIITILSTVCAGLIVGILV